MRRNALDLFPLHLPPFLLDGLFKRLLSYTLIDLSMRGCL